MNEPMHPGPSVRTEYIEAQNLSVAEAAKRLGVLRQTLTNLITGKSAVSPAMALRLERVGCGSAEVWMLRQILYDLVLARANTDIVVPGATSPDR